MAEIIAVTNQKGGVGKTTTSVNLAACLSAAKYKTLLVDLDPQGNASSAVGVDPRSASPNLYRSLLGLEDPTPLDLHERFPRLSVLPSNRDLAGAELELIQIDDRDTRLRNLLANLPPDYDFIVLDSPPSLGLITLNILNAARWVIIPVQAEFLSLEGLSHIMDTIQRVQKSGNPKLDLMGVVVTMFDGRTRLASEVVAELEKNFGPKLFKTRISRAVRLSEAPSHGAPIIYYDFRSPASIAHIQLCEEVLHAAKKAGFGKRS